MLVQAMGERARSAQRAEQSTHNHATLLEAGAADTEVDQVQATVGDYRTVDEA